MHAFLNLFEVANDVIKFREGGGSYFGIGSSVFATCCGLGGISPIVALHTKRGFQFLHLGNQVTAPRASA